MGSIAIGKNEIVLAALESAAFDENTALLTRRTAPGVADDGVLNRILITGEGAINQELELLEDEQVRGGRSRRSRISGRYNPGTFTLPCYLKTGGKDGGAGLDKMKVPEMDVLLRSAMGSGTAVASSSTSDTIDYTLTDRNRTFTLWIKKDHTVFIGIGATANMARFEIKGSDIGRVTFEGEFMAMLRAGYGDVLTPIASGTSTDTVVLAAGQGKYFDPGTFVTINGVNNSNAGFLIDAITGDTLTLSAAVTFNTANGFVDGLAAGAVVRGYIPFSDHASQAERGVPLHGKRGLLTMDDGGGAVNTFILESTLELNNNIKYSTDEKNGVFYPTDFFTSEFREVTGTLKLYFRPDVAKFWKEAYDRTTFSMVLPCGDQTGHTFKLLAPAVEIGTPRTTGANEVEADIDYKAVLSAAVNDEFSIQLA